MKVFCWNWRRQLAAIAFGLRIGICAVVYACNVPVFRFALERWRPDPYRVTLVHRRELSDAQKEIIRPLEEAQDKGSANVMFRIVDASESDKLGDDGLLIVQYPEHLRIDMPVWKGPLSRENVEMLTDSPVRRELVRRLAEGQTAVWLLLESGQTEKDDAAVELLNTEFKRLEQELKLPELTSDPADELLAATPLKVAFSVLRVPHGVGNEQALAAMLINCESDLAGRSEPIVYPVFGRGRVLLPLIGAGITAKNIEDSAAFLVGPCSCQVKELNPGFDLLLSVEWDALLSQDGQRSAERRVGKG